MAGKVTKAELIEALHATSALNRKDIHGLIDALFEEIKGAILQEKTVELRGFGTFEVKLRKGRKRARNPKTGQSSRSRTTASPRSDRGANSRRPPGTSSRAPHQSKKTRTEFLPRSSR